MECPSPYPLLVNNVVNGYPYEKVLGVKLGYGSLKAKVIKVSHAFC